jgi:Ca2+-dependent lipid-binding protein
VVKLGNKTHTTRSRYKHNTRDPRFFEVFEFHSKLPGINDILISVKDHNDYTLDELIGSTVIDLEDR